ncbi:MAG: CRISPR-associated endoribonuclease Cas6 [Bacteroidia bacterium]|nr:CRISPR-associated endoribonuclease Cas6 [Bacteroidia bacterium]
MRFSIFLKVTQNSPALQGKLPLDYRQGIASLLKAVLKKKAAHLYRFFYHEEGHIKPFSFAVYFPELRGDEVVEGDRAERKYLKVGSRAICNFTFADEIIGAQVLNAFLAYYHSRQRNKQRVSPYGERKPLSWHVWRKQWEFEITHVRLHPLRRIQGERAVFYTLSPFLVNTQGEKYLYLTPEAGDAFREGLQFHLRELSQHFLGRAYELDWERCDFRGLRPVKVWHYEQYMTANRGKLVLAGPAPLLDLIYRAGLGVRRSQGFGMVEIQKLL